MSINIPNFKSIFSQKDIRETATAELFQQFKIVTDANYTFTSSYANTMNTISVNVGEGQGVLILYNCNIYRGAGNYIDFRFTRDGNLIGQASENNFLDSTHYGATESKSFAMHYMETPGKGNFTYAIQGRNDDPSGSAKDQTFIVIVFNKRS